MSVLAACIVVIGLLVSITTCVAAVRSWSDGGRVGRKPLIVAVALAAMVVVQLPLPDGPSWRNVPMAFVILAGQIN